MKCFVRDGAFVRADCREPASALFLAGQVNTGTIVRMRVQLPSGPGQTK